jgi:RNA polymerase sigma-70 factor, ECF subfamily
MAALAPRQAVAHADPQPTRLAGKPSFAELFQEHGAYVWHALRRLGVTPRELEDLTHDVFLQVFRHLHDYDPARPIKPWLFGFAFRVASQHRRRARVRSEQPSAELELVDGAPNAVEHLLTQERLDLAREALESLELERRAVFILHELDGCPIPVVAETLGIPLGTAYSRLRLARDDFSRAAQRLRARQR